MEQRQDGKADAKGLKVMNRKVIKHRRTSEREEQQGQRRREGEKRG